MLFVKSHIMIVTHLIWDKKKIKNQFQNI